MDARITSIENLMTSDPGGRNVFGLMMAGQLQLAARSLQLAKRVGIVSGFFIPGAGAGETDGPPGAKTLGEALRKLGIEVDYITDEWNAALFQSIGLAPLLDGTDYIERVGPTHLVAIERLGRAKDGRYHNMRGVDVTSTTAPLDELFLEAGSHGITTVGIGDGGNEIGMGKVFADGATTMPSGQQAATVVATDFCIAAGVSNWGAYGLAGALSVLAGRDLLPTAQEAALDIDRLVEVGGAVDGITGLHEATVDGIGLPASLRMLEDIRRQIVASPLDRRGADHASNTLSPLQRRTRNRMETPGESSPHSGSLRVGLLGYGESGRAAGALLARQGHRVCVSDQAGVTLQPGTLLAGIETGGHTIEFLESCDLVVASPGVRPDSPIRNALHRRGIAVMSELELAYQLCSRPLIAVTGTVGKRTTVELLQHVFGLADRRVSIGGNRGRPLSALLLDEDAREPIAVAVSSFQLDSVIRFCPNVAIILNISEAHLDRHRSLAEYARTKARIFMNQGHADASSNHAPPHDVRDVLILPFDDARVRSLARKHRGRTFFVSTRQAVDRGAWLLRGKLYVSVEGTVEEIGPINPTGVEGPVRFPENLLSCVVTARLYGIGAERIGRAVTRLRREGVIE